MLKQLFDNLIGNALKYNNKQTPSIKISSEIEKDSLKVKIEDNGIGIPEVKVKDVFKAFLRAHSSKEYKGSRVELATCKKIMDIHSGTISVDSEVGKGSCFVLEF